VHGWAFGPECFDALAPLLAEWPQARFDLGFFGAPDIPDFMPGDVMVGHSMGFLRGLSQDAAWAGVVAINGFARFTLEDGRGCVRPAELRALRKAFLRDPQLCVDEFRARHGGGATGAVRIAALAAGLDFLESCDVRPSPLAGEGRTSMTAERAMSNGPRLVLAAQDDPLVPLDAARELAQTGDDWAVRPSGGHGLPWTAPEFCAGKIRDFLRRHGFR